MVPGGYSSHKRLSTPFFFPSSFVCVHCCVLRNPAKGRTNMELREKFILADGASQGMAAFRPRGRRSRPSSRGASPNRSTSLSSQAGQVASPQAPATSTPKVGRGHETFSSFYTNQRLENTLECFRTLAFVGPDFSIYVPSRNKANEGYFCFLFFFSICFCLWPT